MYNEGLNSPPIPGQLSAEYKTNNKTAWKNTGLNAPMEQTEPLTRTTHSMFTTNPGGFSYIKTFQERLQPYHNE